MALIVTMYVKVGVPSDPNVDGSDIYGPTFATRKVAIVRKPGNVPPIPGSPFS